MVGYITTAHGIAQRLNEKWRHCACTSVVITFCTFLFCVGVACVRARACVRVHEKGQPKRGCVRVRAQERPAKERVGTLKKKKGLHTHAEASTTFTAAGGGGGVWDVGSCAMKKALHAYCGAERAVGSGSGACGAVRGVAPFLCANLAYQQAAEAGASALAAMRRRRYARQPPPTRLAGSSGSQAPRQRVGDECRRRLMSMLS